MGIYWFLFFIFSQKKSSEKISCVVDQTFQPKISAGPKSSPGPGLTVVAFDLPVGADVMPDLASTACSTRCVVFCVTIGLEVVWVEFILVVWVELDFVVWALNFGVGADSPPTFLPSGRVVLTVVLVEEVGTAALTFVVVTIRPPDFGVVMVVLGPIVLFAEVSAG